MINQWLVDTGAWIAFFEEGDRWHKVVGNIFREFAEKRLLLYSSDSVILEFITFLRKAGRPIDYISERVDAIRSQLQDVLFSDPSLLEKMCSLLRRTAYPPLEGVDVELLALMQTHRITCILTVDEAFLRIPNLDLEVRPNWQERQQALT